MHSLQRPCQTPHQLRYRTIDALASMTQQHWTSLPANSSIVNEPKIQTITPPLLQWSTPSHLRREIIVYLLTSWYVLTTHTVPATALLTFHFTFSTAEYYGSTPSWCSFLVHDSLTGTSLPRQHCLISSGHFWCPSSLSKWPRNFPHPLQCLLHSMLRRNYLSR